MLLEYDGGWIETLDYIPIRSYKKIQEGKVGEALRFLITDWSSIHNRLTLYNIRRLKYEIGVEIIDTLVAKIKWFMEIENATLEHIVTTFVKGLRPSDEIATRVATEYLPMVGVCLNSKGDIIHFPVAGGYEDQPVDSVRFLTTYRYALLEYINTQKRR